MCAEATKWENGAYLPDHAARQTCRVMAPMAYTKVKHIIEKNVTSFGGRHELYEVNCAGS